jgi:hypothetical protein
MSTTVFVCDAKGTLTLLLNLYQIRITNENFINKELLFLYKQLKNNVMGNTNIAVLTFAVEFRQLPNVLL